MNERALTGPSKTNILASRDLVIPKVGCGWKWWAFEREGASYKERIRDGEMSREAYFLRIVDTVGEAFKWGKKFKSRKYETETNWNQKG